MPVVCVRVRVCVCVRAYMYIYTQYLIQHARNLVDIVFFMIGDLTKRLYKNCTQLSVLSQQIILAYA